MTERLAPHELLLAMSKAERLPSLPAVALEVLRLCREEATTLDDLAAAIANDPLLSARLLRFANSSLFNAGAEITTLRRATLVLGMKTVQLMSLSFSLAGTLSQARGAKGFDHEQYWRRALALAVAGRSLATLAQTMTEDEAFLCGLLSEIGQLALAQCLAENYAEVLRRANGAWPSRALEMDVLGFDHVDVGQALLVSWGLPELVTGTLRAQHAAAELDPALPRERVKLAKVMHLAQLTVELLCSKGKGDALRQLEECGYREFGFSPETLYGFVTALEAGIRETSRLFNVETDVGRSHAEILEEARAQILSISSAAGLELDPLGHDVKAHEQRLSILADRSLRDPLTGLTNKRGFERFLELELELRRTGRIARPLGLLVLEIERFDAVKSAFGPAGMDELLRLVAQTLAVLLRKGDLAARMTPSRFSVLMVEASPFGLRTLAERLHEGVRERGFEFGGQRLAAAVAIGGACIAQVSSVRDGVALQAIAVRHLIRARQPGSSGIDLHPCPIQPGQPGA